MKTAVIILFLTCVTGLSFSQVSQQWAKRYSSAGALNDYARAITYDTTGNVYVTGGSPGNGTSIDYFTIKLTSLGDTLWTARYNGFGAGVDIASSIAVDDLGNVYVTGRSDQSLTNFDYATLKYNSSGVQQWAKRYNRPLNGNDAASSLVLDG